MGHAVLEHEAKKRGLPVVVDSAVSGAGWIELSRWLVCVFTGKGRGIGHSCVS